MCAKTYTHSSDDLFCTKYTQQEQSGNSGINNNIMYILYKNKPYDTSVILVNILFLFFLLLFSTDKQNIPVCLSVSPFNQVCDYFRPARKKHQILMWAMFLNCTWYDDSLVKPITSYVCCSKNCTEHVSISVCRPGYPGTRVMPGNGSFSGNRVILSITRVTRVIQF